MMKMKKILSLLLALVMLIGAVSMLSSCGKKNSEIRVYLGDQIYDFDPALAFVDDNVNRVMSLIFEPLFLLNADGSVSKGLAKSYKIIEKESEGLYQMEIKLRKTYWNDGKSRVTADDVYFAWTRILDPEFESQAAPLLYDIKNAKAVKQDADGISRNDLGLEANKDTITITFEGKIDYKAFLRNLTSVALSPLRENKVTEGDPNEEYWAKRSSYIATNGPFSIRSWNRDTGEFTLQRNEYYHVSNPQKSNSSGSVAPSRIYMEWTNENFGMDYDEDMGAFLEDKFDNYYDSVVKQKLSKDELAEIAEDVVFVVGAMPLDKELRASYKKEADIRDAFSTYTYIFNTEKEPFNDENVRKALSLVIDREYIAEELVFAKAADGFISPAVWEATKKKTSFRSKAKSLIETKANEAAALELLETVDVASFDTIELTVRNTVEEVMIAEYVAEQWGVLGFDVEINAVTVDTEIWAKEKGEPGRDVTVGGVVTVYDDGIQAAYISGKFDVLGVDYNMYSTNALTALCGFTTLLNGNGVEYSIVDGVSTAEHRLHCSGFSDAAYDAIIDRALAEPSLKKRATILHEAEEYLMSKMPVMPIVYNQNYYLIEKVSGIKYNGYGNPIFNSAHLNYKFPKVADEKDD